MWRVYEIESQSCIEESQCIEYWKVSVYIVKGDDA